MEATITLDFVNQDNYIFETVYGIARKLYENIETTTHLISTVSHVVEYIARQDFVLEKAMYKRADYEEYERMTADYLVNIDEYNQRRSFNQNDIFNKLSGTLVGDSFSLNSVFVEPFVSFIFSTDMKYMFPLPFYCLETINVLDSLFTEAAAVLSLTTDYLPVHNEIFYEIVEEKERYMFFSSVIGLGSFLRNRPCASDPPLRQVYMLTTAEYSYYRTPTYFFEKFRKSKFLAYRQTPPYELIGVGTAGAIIPKNAVQTHPYFSQSQILNVIKEHVPIKHILFGQCRSSAIPAERVRYWIKRGRLLSTFAWRPIINHEGYENSHAVMIICTVSDGTHLMQYEADVEDADSFISKFKNIYTPPIMALRSIPMVSQPEVAASNSINYSNANITNHTLTISTTTNIQRIFQQIGYIHSLQTTIITNYTIWPSSIIRELSLFKGYTQKTIDVETIKDIMKDSFNLDTIKNRAIYEQDGISLNKITFDGELVMYSFSTGAGAVTFSMFDFLYKLLHDIRINKTKQHALITSLLNLFDLI